METVGGKPIRSHGLYRTPENISYHNMKARCLNKNNQAYHNYGGRGITICDRWLESFMNFYEDMGKKPKGSSLDRIDNSKGYSKENCRWADKVTQALNTRVRSTTGKSNIHYNKAGYNVRFQRNNKNSYHGTYRTLKEAISVRDRILNKEKEELNGT